MPTLTVRKPAEVPQPEQRRPLRLIVTMPDGRLFCRACMAAYTGPGPCPAGHQ